MKYIKNLFTEYEIYCSEKRAQSKEAKKLFYKIKAWFNSSTYEYCAHNAAILGSKHYEKDKINGINHLITKEEYKKQQAEGE